VTYVGRFAPSPTGPLHFGSLVAAVASWLDARAHGGRWLVRIEDVDTTRTVPGAAEEILRALEGFGLHRDGEVVWQSRRTQLYEAALEELRLRNLVYRCRCSRKEIADSAAQGIEGAIYPGTCRDAAIEPRTASAARLRVEDAAIAFDDRVQGRVTQDVRREVGDFILKRRDALHAYQLAVVVDDAAQGVTDIVRGADLLQSTARQVLLQRLLGLPTPRYLHFPVATNAQGEKLSKQTLAPAAGSERAAELLRTALAFLGQPTPAAARPARILAEAAAAWDASRIPRRLAMAVAV
jgi:glutamyl-Q tRNA(Asp) synthetase